MIFKIYKNSRGVLVIIEWDNNEIVFANGLLLSDWEILGLPDLGLPDLGSCQLELCEKDGDIFYVEHHNEN